MVFKWERDLWLSPLSKHCKNLAKDLLFLKELEPHMVGIGPFIPPLLMIAKFRENSAGSLDKTLVMLALTRLLLPKVLLPATTALGTKTL